MNYNFIKSLPKSVIVIVAVVGLLAFISWYQTQDGLDLGLEGFRSTKCFSCERQMPQVAHGTKCFSCERQMPQVAHGTKCHSCENATKPWSNSN